MHGIEFDACQMNSGQTHNCESNASRPGIDFMESFSQSPWSGQGVVEGVQQSCIVGCFVLVATSHPVILVCKVEFLQ